MTIFWETETYTFEYCTNSKGQLDVLMKKKETTMTKSVPQALADLGKLFEERNALYKDNYKNFGKTLMGLFPNGITLKTAEEFNRFALFLQIVHKQSRYAQNVTSGGHADSLDDISVYAQMLREYDDENSVQIVFEGNGLVRGKP